MTTKNTAPRRLAAGTGAFALALACAMGTATSAWAEQGVDGTPPGNAAEGTTGTLVIHKHVGTTTQDPNNGTEQDIDRAVIADVEFTICLVEGVDLTTEAGWDAAADLDPADATCADGTTTSDTTDASGEVSFDGLAIGLYKVVESDAPDIVTDRAADFLVSIPYPSVGGTPAATNWLWTVHVYPKNGIDSDNEKTVSDPATNGLGSSVPFQISTRLLGSFGDGAPLTAYNVTDVLDPRLTYDTGSAIVKMVSPAGAATTLTAGNEYTLTAPSGSGGDLVVTFDVDYVNDLPVGSYFTVDFTATVTSIGDGTIKNTATEYINDQDEGYDTNEVSTDWGDARLLKYHQGDLQKPLVGAEFEVYNPGDDGCVAPLGSQVTVDGESTFVSDGDGEVYIAGLYVGKDGETDSRTYCVVETVAPAGYTLVSTPIAITVTPGGLAEGEYSYEVPNPPKDGPDLPLTGANGTWAMTIGGLLLVGGGTAAIVLSRRRRGAAA